MSATKMRKIEIAMGDEGRSYKTGDFLNALDELICAYTQTEKMAESEVIGALKLYTEQMEGWQ